MDGEAVATIAAMALVTYATRAGGLWLLARVTSSRWIETWLRAVPGALLAALVAPAVLTRGPEEALTALATALVMVRTGSVVLAMAAGIGLVVLRGLG